MLPYSGIRQDVLDLESAHSNLFLIVGFSILIENTKVELEGQLRFSVTQHTLVRNPDH